VPIVLRNGIKLRSLEDGRDLLLAMGDGHLAREHWRQTFELLRKAAAAGATELDVARAARQLSRALETEELVD
jgi:hypothetical protein